MIKLTSKTVGTDGQINGCFTLDVLRADVKAFTFLAGQDVADPTTIHHTLDGIMTISAMARTGVTIPMR